ncbi:hypothetical protein COT30_00895 [Candidatus Micrarchaeota archaeon CG08_land_8_20_14_0_20_49_17]|nr:MAG: hypothetical protein COT30_00895 [Candidatus Micrarchaeota archaeon CG08_land_8_20_14_0_20_49_17]PIU81797.1 MAG: hypothetical protein COS70_02450 [Candidatus Micrarchaeota archaeon CG06_land_8_20_14_3_00_50_6]PIZ93573.1 MAG: hypothetical protein COX84_05895 [Candidatus Micrarchaeota archaeon CG_4_10_14_0_2_um_filter_49_7]
MVKQKLFEKLKSLLIERGARKVEVFGSYAKGKATPKSDIDVIVEFRETQSLLDLVRIEREVSAALGIKVDLLTKGAISPYILESIQKNKLVL